MGKRRKRQEWLIGDVFVVRQLDEMCSLGQVLTLMMPNVVSCAFFDIRLSCDEANGAIELSLQQLNAVMSVTRERLDFGEWTIVGHQHVTLDRELWPNEEFRQNRWIGAKISDAGIAVSFLNAFYGLVPWDAWKDPQYFDKLLAFPGRRPKNVVLTRPQ